MAEDDILSIIQGLKAQLNDLAQRYKQLRQEKANNASSNSPSNSGQTAEQQAPPRNNNPQTNPSPASSANTLSGSVGRGGQNNPNDVRRVQNLLNRHGIRPSLVEDGIVGPRTIAAIEQFQNAKLGISDGLVEPNRNTWRALLGHEVPRANPSNQNNQTNTNTNNQNNNASPPQNNNPTNNNSGGVRGNLPPDRSARLAQQVSDTTSPLTGSVGRGGQNNPNDVRLIQELLGLRPTGQADAALEQAIRAFQGKLTGLGVDGRVDRVGKTLRFLIAYQNALNVIPDVPEAQSVRMQNPLPGGTTFSPFGPRFGRMHNGIDLVKGGNARVLAAVDGEVVVSSNGHNGGYGNLVEIQHANGYRTLYAHLASISVSRGTRVTAGQAIGIEGTTGNSQGIHLHFEVIIRGNKVDPLPFLTGSKRFPR